MILTATPSKCTKSLTDGGKAGDRIRKRPILEFAMVQKQCNRCSYISDLHKGRVGDLLLL